MSAHIHAFLDEGLARGFSLSEVADALASRLESGSSPNQNPHPGVPSGSETLPFEDGPTAIQATDVAPAADSRPVPPLPTTPSPEQRYEDLGQLGMGGMGEVRRVRDRRLGRTLAMKTLHTAALSRPSLVARFLEEAQATAQLQHPGIVPIHDLGQLADGRLWFTMKEVAGQDLRALIDGVHGVSRQGWQSTASGWTLRRLVGALRQVCDAVGYAHRRGVVHRDLKPDNIMVGAHGEVFVLDWGLAKVRGGPAAEPGGPPLVTTDRSRTAVHQTQVGRVAGTPAYMPPEQAEGRLDAIDARSDVYALGAILYRVLSGRSPYRGFTVEDVLNQVRSGPPPSLAPRSDTTLHPDPVPGAPSEAAQAPAGPVLPSSLVAICERAMARSPEDRFTDASAMAAALQSWLDGAQRRADARAVLTHAEAQAPHAAALRARATALQDEAARLMRGVETWHPETAKVPAWDKEDEAHALERRAERAELTEELLIQGALTHAPDLPEAHALLARRYREAHAAQEATRQDTARVAALLRQHVDALPPSHPDRAGHVAYLKGDGALTLVTDPPGAEVLLHRYTTHHRRMVPRFERNLGRTPIKAMPLPMGSYLIVLRHPDRAEVRYPVSIGRGAHWHGEPPEGGGPHPIALPRRDQLGPEDRYVPAGWFDCGGDPHQERSLPAQRVWVDGVIFRRLPVTNRQYIAFLDALVDAGRVEDALRHAPRERASSEGTPGALIYGFDGRRFSLQPDSEGQLWDPDWPVMMVDWHGAQAFAAEAARRDRLPWRLPGELAWEKAARGVDGRFFPWGDRFDPSWSSMRLSREGQSLPTPVGAFPLDESPYGIRDLAGSIQDWTAEAFAETGPPPSSARHTGGAEGTPSGDRGEGAWAEPGADAAPPRRVYRGGCWFSPSGALRACFRGGAFPTLRHSTLGFRLARPFP